MSVGRVLSGEFRSRLGIPAVHWSATLAEIPDQCSHREIIEKWCDNVMSNVEKSRGLLLMGEYSQGKSAIGSICLKAAACHGIIGFWVSARALAEYKIEKTGFDEYQTIWERAQQAPLLVIDEVQIRDNAKFTELALEELVRGRVDNQLCVILTTNHGREELQQRHPALMAVLQEAVVPVKVSGHDFRKEYAKELA